MSYGRRYFRGRKGSRDANHKAIADGLRKLGFIVDDLAGVGGGMPDLLVWARPDLDPRRVGPVYLELKVGDAKPSASQLKWHAERKHYGIRVYIVRSLDDALAALREPVDVGPEARAE